MDTMRLLGVGCREKKVVMFSAKVRTEISRMLYLCMRSLRITFVLAYLVLLETLRD